MSFYENFVPRFSWEQRKLGDVGKARSGVGFPDSEQGSTVGIPFFKVSDMNTDGNENEMTVANNYVTDAQIGSRRWSPIEDLPAIFFAKVGAAVMLNRKRLCRFPFLLDNNTMAYSLDKNVWDADFAKAIFETVDLTSLVQVGALPSYNAGDVEAMEIMLPKRAEQEKIGTYFRHLDALIALHQQ
ncbi:restriction endonuclease subunit S [Pseudoramibacter alactolyticus]|uniref:restriction endonuclease subunit S n=1 Tax=Pseudoramibacter alactolyticus TaxID=113287 RepID=UPI00248E899F|nr:restriction endonuclease subunit S [Pseudoramibacter alactolyticus]